MGILGVFTVIAFVTTVVAEVKGEQALKQVFVLLLFGIPLMFVIRTWRRY